MRYTRPREYDVHNINYYPRCHTCGELITGECYEYSPQPYFYIYAHLSCAQPLLTLYDPPTRSGYRSAL